MAKKERKTFKCAICSRTFEMNLFQPSTVWVDKDRYEACVICYRLAKITDVLTETHRMVLNG